MSKRPHQLLSLLLSVLLAFGPAGTAWANATSSSADEGDTAHALAQHAGHTRLPDTGMDSTNPTDAEMASACCDACDGQCASASGCGDPGCSSCTLGLPALASAAKFEHPHRLPLLDPHLALSERANTLFRPPQGCTFCS